MLSALVRGHYGWRSFVVLAACVAVGAAAISLAVHPQQSGATTLCDQAGGDCETYCNISTAAYDECSEQYDDLYGSEPVPYGNQASQGALGTGPSTCVHDWLWVGYWESYYRTCNNGYVDDSWAIGDIYTEDGTYALAVAGNNDSSSHVVTGKVALVHP